jgi:transcriptional regulator with XRE-family HTH domain
MRESVAEEVRVMMVRKRITGAALAERIGRSAAYLSRRLTGETAFDLDDLFRISEVLGVRMVDLLPRDQRERVTGQYVAGGRDVKTLTPAQRSAGPVSGLRAPLPDKMMIGVPARPNPTRTADRRPTLVRPRGI